MSGALALAFVLSGGVAYLVLTRPVPDVVGLPPAQATTALTEAGFPQVTTTNEFSPTVPRGQVMEQSPAAGARSRSGEPVSLVVSRGEAKVVPILTGKGASEANSQVSLLDLDLTTSEQPSDSVPEGQIISQNPSPGTLLEEGDQVSVLVSTGPPYTTVYVSIDLFSVVLDSSISSCSEAMSYLQILFSNAQIQDGQGGLLSTMSGTWNPDSSNGYLFPCKASAEFPRTSTQESVYVFDIEPSDPGSNQSWTRSELESNNWIIQLG